MFFSLIKYADAHVASVYFISEDRQAKINGGKTMKKRLLAAILVLMMATATLASCQEGEDVSETPTSSETEMPTSGESEVGESEVGESDDESESEAPSSDKPNESEEESDTEGEKPTEPSIEDIIYDNGEDIPEAGISWADSADEFMLEEHSIDESKAVLKSAAEMLELLADKDKMAKGEVYRVTEPLKLASGVSYYGNFAVVIAEGGVSIADSEGTVLKDIIIKGDIVIENSKDISFYKLDLKAGKEGITTNSKCSNIKIENSVIEASSIAIKNTGKLLSVYKCKLIADKGISSSGTDLAVQDCMINGASAGVVLKGKYPIVRNNTITVDKEGVGIDLIKGSYNGLVALNTVKDAQTSISVVEGYNCTVLLNSAITVKGENNTNLYVVENSLGGAIVLKNNKYLLCEGNKFLSDGKAHPVINTDNSEYNGDDLHDVNARVEYGANEELLPHTNKDLFIGMEKRTEVRDISEAKSYEFGSYLQNVQKAGSYIIVPPGVYSVGTKINLTFNQSNTVIYAYGVYSEKVVSKNKNGEITGAPSSSLGVLLNVSGANIAIHGLTMGYDFQSSGQAYVLEKLGSGQVRIISAAGYTNVFAAAKTSIFSSSMHIMKGDELCSWAPVGSEMISQNGSMVADDGTMIINVADAKIYSDLEPGDVLTCRLAGDNSASITLSGGNLLFKDCVLYGYSAALAIRAAERTSFNTKLERFHNTARPAPVITKEIYEKYKALEEKYGMTSDGEAPVAEGAQGLEVYIDANGNYRGALPRSGSVDAVHVIGAGEGISATSCIFEQMVDDSSNQRASSSRIAGYHDNGDGTSTIYYKGMVAINYHQASASAGAAGNLREASKFQKGDVIYAYASSGRELINAKVVGGTTNASNIPSDVHIAHIDANKDCICDNVSCKASLHYDHVTNGTSTIKPDDRCDTCGIKVHTDYSEGRVYDGINASNTTTTFYTGNNLCDVCGGKLEGKTTDAGGNVINSSDKAPIITNPSAPARLSGSTLTFKMLGVNKSGQKCVVNYSTKIYAVKVNTKDVNLKALEGFDLTDNSHFMNNKILCDNLSLNSCDFTFDNVMMRNYYSRGILAKSHNTVIKNCTFRNVAKTAVLLSVEVRWGESTVVKNFTVEGCLFDNTGDMYNTKNDRTQSPISIQGVGEVSSYLTEISADTLPCENISIVGNKFVNITNNYFISVEAAQKVTIKNNIFSERDGETVKKPGKAIYIDRCLDVEISGNTYSKYAKGDMTKLIIGWNYKDLHGSDVEGVLPEEKGANPAT